MTEFSNSAYELSPQGLRQYLEDISVDYIAYTRPSITSKHATALALNAATGERILIEKSIEGAQSKGYFFQDLNMSVFPGRSLNFEAQQVDFNFNEHGDGELRKRVISGNENGVEEIPEDASDEYILQSSRLTLHHAKEFTENIHLEEQMGINNQPATPEEIAEAMRYLDGATVLDPQYKPVAILS